MAYIIFSLAVILLVVGATLFIVHKSTELVLTPKDLAAILNSGGENITIKIYVRSKCSWREKLSKAKSVK